MTNQSICEFCGADVPPKGRFCQECGNTAGDPTPRPKGENAPSPAQAAFPAKETPEQAMTMVHDRSLIEPSVAPGQEYQTSKFHTVAEATWKFTLVLVLFLFAIDYLTSGGEILWAFWPAVPLICVGVLLPLYTSHPDLSGIRGSLPLVPAATVILCIMLIGLNILNTGSIDWSVWAVVPLVLVGVFLPLVLRSQLSPDSYSPPIS